MQFEGKQMIKLLSFFIYTILSILNPLAVHAVCAARQHLSNTDVYAVLLFYVGILCFVRQVNSDRMNKKAYIFARHFSLKNGG